MGVARFALPAPFNSKQAHIAILLHAHTSDAMKMQFDGPDCNRDLLCAGKSDPGRERLARAGC